ncbi:hypothetical protein ACOMHN_043429 [Nucella lapillus]
MDVLKHTLVLALAGCLVNIDQAGGLCTDMEGTCQEWGIDTHNRLLSHPDADYRHCDAKLDQEFMDTTNEYLGSCNNEGQPLPVNVPDDPATDLEVEDTINRAEIEEMDARLLRECPAYVKCSEVYHNAVQATAYLNNDHQRLTSLCVANRLNLVCMSDAFCSCGEGDNQILQKTMTQIRVGHETNCQEQITEAIMKCASSASILMSTTVFLLTTTLFQLALGAGKA